MQAQTRPATLERQLRSIIEIAQDSVPFAATIAQFALTADDLEQAHALLGQLYIVAMMEDRADIAELANDAAHDLEVAGLA